MGLSTPAFLWIGMGLAVLPVLLHLISQRRQRVVRWAAMSLLREAVTRRQSALRMRDLALLILRTLAMLLLGIGFAGPYWGLPRGATGRREPVHAVILLDNSLSMTREQLSGTLLEEAKRRARSIVESLAEGSAVSVLTLAETGAVPRLEAIRSRSGALEALDSVIPVDAAADLARAVSLVRESCSRSGDSLPRRLVVLSDLQRTTWGEAYGARDALVQLRDELGEGGTVEVIRIESGSRSNTSVAAIERSDPVVGVGRRAEIVAELRNGDTPRRGLEVTFTVAGNVVASRTIDLASDQTRRVAFPFSLDAGEDESATRYVAVSVSITEDELPGDDRRFAVVPVARELPIVLVDSVGERGGISDPIDGSYYLRRLLSPADPGGSIAEGSWARLRRLRIEEIDRDRLRDARVVVLVDIERPGRAVRVLAEHVAFGGRLVVVTGGRFDPVRWTEDLAGARRLDLLPARLRAELVRARDDVRGAPGETPFVLDTASLAPRLFALPGESPDALRALWTEPAFYRASAVDESERPGALESSASPSGSLPSGSLPSGSLRSDSLPSDSEGSWLAWRVADLSGDPLGVGAPRVLARFENGAPFLLARRWGLGETLLVTSGVDGRWNNLVRTNAMLLWDRLLRGLVADTLLELEREGVVETRVPINDIDRDARIELERPSGEREELLAEAVAASGFAVSIRDVTQRGHQILRAFRRTATDPEAANQPLWVLPVAFNGPAVESDLESLDESEFAPLLAALDATSSPGEDPESSGGGADLGRLFLFAALFCLLLEMALIARDAHVRRRASSPSPSIRMATRGDGGKS